MAGIDDYNINPDLNVEIAGINIREGCPAKNLNNAYRQGMADIANWKSFLYNAGTSPFALLTGATFTGAINGTAATFSGNLKAGAIYPSPTDGSYYATFLGSVPILNWDANDYDAYDRSSNSRNFFIGGQNKVAITSGGLTINGGLTASGNIVAAGAQFGNNGNIQFGGVSAYTGNATDMTAISGSSQWRVVNQAFNVELFRVSNTGDAIITGRTTFANDALFYTTKAGPNPIINWDTNDYSYFDRATNDHAWVVAGSVYMSLGSTSGGLAVNVAIKRDSQYYLDFGGGDPLINFDATDYIQFTRGNNLYSFVSGGVPRMTINSGGGVVATAFTPTSDRSIKSEIADVDPSAALAMIRAIGGKHYLKNGEPEYGIIAQDAQEAGLGDLVHEGPNGLLCFNYNGLSAIINATLINLDDRVKALEAA